MSLRKKILKDNGVKMSMVGVFFLPTFNIPKKLLTQNYIGMYIKDFEIPTVVLLFDRDDDLLEPIMMHLTNHYGFIDHYIDEVNNEVGIEIQIERKYKQDFEKFLDSKYSQFSHGLKTLITNYHGNTRGQDHLVLPYDAIYPTAEKRKALAKRFGVDESILPDEVGTRFSIDREIFLTLEELKLKYGIKQQESTV